MEALVEIVRHVVFDNREIARVVIENPRVFIKRLRVVGEDILNGQLLLTFEPKSVSWRAGLRGVAVVQRDACCDRWNDRRRRSS
jgi:hypothetical protein